ncbi:torsin-2A-like [Penaeus chinensis]|uniref:torsin-2A-like n=1 Tax=Penaeus chinensis TaxID=139456 RepID=UPI001FB69739|nr:torsin-2A-like [Penaeus chinensis]
MEEPCTPRGTRRSKLTRSHSEQPEEWCLSSSPYSTRRKPKSPGRSLTAIFTRPERTERASSEDTRTLYRRKTIGTFFGDRRFPAVPEDEHISLEKCVTEKKNHNISLSLFSDLENVEDSYFSNSYSGIYEQRDNYNASYEQRDHYNDSYEDRDNHSGSYENRNNYSGVFEHRDRFDLMAPVSRVESCLRRRNAVPVGENSDVSKPPAPKSSSLLCSLLMRIGKLFFWCAIIVFLVVLGIVIMSTFILHQKSVCEQRQGLKIPLDALREDLTSQVIGQDIANNVLLDSLQKLQEDDSSEPLIMWMVGWSGSGKTHTINIIKNLFPDPSQVRTFIPSILMFNSNNLQKHVTSLLKKLDSCGPRLIIIDGWDEDNDISINVLQTLVKEFKKPSKDKPTGRIIVIITGTEGSREINRKYLKLRVEGKGREDLQLKDFTEVTRDIVTSRNLYEDFRRLVVVPFMPLEKLQVQQCVLQELDKIQENIEEKYRNSLASKQSSVVEDVVKQINFIPAGQPLLSATGCKRVQPLLRLLLTEVR